MKAYDFFEEAMLLLGYMDFEGKIEDNSGLKARSQAAINLILKDLEIDLSIKKLTDTVTLSTKKADALTLGLAMLLALFEGDGEKNRLYCELYNAKRATCKGGKGEIRDTLPVGYGA